MIHDGARVAFFAIILCLLSPPAQAAIRAQIGGGTTCGAWTQKRSANIADASETWIMGYLSRAAFDYPGDILAEPDHFALAAWIDNYCRANTLENISTAANMLETELARRSTPPTGKRP